MMPRWPAGPHDCFRQWFECLARIANVKVAAKHNGAMKHGGRRIMLWGFISAVETERIVRIEGKNNTTACGDILGTCFLFFAIFSHLYYFSDEMFEVGVCIV